MKSPNSKFLILVGKLKRHERSCRKQKLDDINHKLSNVSYGKGFVTIKTKTGNLMTLYGDKITHSDTTLSYSDIEKVEWIVPESNAILKARNKAKKFNNLYVFHSGGRLDLEGLGQAVFPVMSFIEWARRK